MIGDWQILVAVEVAENSITTTDTYTSAGCLLMGVPCVKLAFQRFTRNRAYPQILDFLRVFRVSVVKNTAFTGTTPSPIFRVFAVVLCGRCGLPASRLCGPLR